MELQFRPRTLPLVRRPFEDEVRRDVVCPHCTLDQTVFGLATWCADCGLNIFMAHVAAELEVTRKMIGDVGRREELLGNRVAAKDLENCLEDVVSIFEAAMKAIVRRAFFARGDDGAQVERRLKSIGNAFQNVERTKLQLKKSLQYDCNENQAWERIGSSFEKRHPVTHNLGVIDKKYLERVQRAEQEGREVRVLESEVAGLIDDVYDMISVIHRDLVNVG